MSPRRSNDSLWQQNQQRITSDFDGEATNISTCCLQLLLGLIKTQGYDPSTLQNLKTQAQRFSLWRTVFDAHEGGLDERIYGTERLRDLLLYNLIGLGDVLAELVFHMHQDKDILNNCSDFYQLRDQVSKSLDDPIQDTEYDNLDFHLSSVLALHIPALATLMTF